MLLKKQRDTQKTLTARFGFSNCVCVCTVLFVNCNANVWTTWTASHKWQRSCRVTRGCSQLNSDDLDWFTRAHSECEVFNSRKTLNSRARLLAILCPVVIGQRVLARPAVLTRRRRTAAAATKTTTTSTVTTMMIHFHSVLWNLLRMSLQKLSYRVMTVCIMIL